MSASFSSNILFTDGPKEDPLPVVDDLFTIEGFKKFPFAPYFEATASESKVEGIKLADWM